MTYLLFGRSKHQCTTLSRHASVQLTVSTDAADTSLFIDAADFIQPIGGIQRMLAEQWLDCRSPASHTCNKNHMQSDSSPACSASGQFTAVHLHEITFQHSPYGKMADLQGTTGAIATLVRHDNDNPAV